MMNPTSSTGNSGIVSEQATPLGLTPQQQQQHLPYSSSLQQQQNLAVNLWLERQQQEEQQRNSLQQALLAAATARKQEQQNILQQRPSSASCNNTIAPPITAPPTLSDARNPQALEVELCRQILQQQQRLAQTRGSVSMDHAKTLLQERLGHLIDTNTSNQEKNSALSVLKSYSHENMKQHRHVVLL